MIIFLILWKSELVSQTGSQLWTWHNATTPRVTVDDTQSQYKIRTVMLKQFDGNSYYGKIIKLYNGIYYLVEYEESDEEEMTHQEVAKHLQRIPYTGGYTEQS